MTQEVLCRGTRGGFQHKCGENLEGFRHKCTQSINSSSSPLQIIAGSLALSTGSSRCMCQIKTPSRFILAIHCDKRLPMNEKSAPNTIYPHLSHCANHSDPQGVTKISYNSNNSQTNSNSSLNKSFF